MCEVHRQQHGHPAGWVGGWVGEPAVNLMRYPHRKRSMAAPYDASAKCLEADKKMRYNSGVEMQTKMRFSHVIKPALLEGQFMRIEDDIHGL